MKPGQKITCINDSVHPVIKQAYQSFPLKGEVYTVRKINPDNAEGGIFLEEIHNKPLYLHHYGGFVEPAFSKDRFRLCGEENFEIDQLEITEQKRHKIQYS